MNIMATAKKSEEGARQYFLAMVKAEEAGEAVDWDAVIAIIDGIERTMYQAQDSADAADYPACADGTF